MHENHAYIANWNVGKLARIDIVNLSNPNEPRFAGEYISNSSGVIGGFETPVLFRMDLQYPNLFLPHSDGFDIIDMADISSPKKVGLYEPDNRSGNAIKVSGSKIIFTHSDSISFIQFDDQFQATSIAEMTTEVIDLRLAIATDIIWDGGDFAYFLVQDFLRGRGGSAGLQIVDVSQFHQPKTVSTLRFPFNEPRGPLTIRGFFNLGSHLIANGFSDTEKSYWIQVMDVSEIEQPRIMDIIRMQPWVRDWYQFGDMLYSASYEDGIGVFDIRNNIPFLLKFVFTPERVNEGYVFLDGHENTMVALLRSFRRSADILQTFKVKPTSFVEDANMYQ